MPFGEKSLDEILADHSARLAERPALSPEQEEERREKASRAALEIAAQQHEAGLLASGDQGAIDRQRFKDEEREREHQESLARQEADRYRDNPYAD